MWENDCSRIESLEKKPVIKGRPHREILVQEKIIHIKGEEILKELANRPSCELFKLWIINPAAINKADLNKACIIKCRNARFSLPSPRTVNISPSWLKVDRAITFFRSVSKLATHPAAIMVITPAISNIGRRSVCLINGKNRITRKTPAVTKVDEWTKAETGVGAAMAAGSQAEKGSWALLVKELIIIKIKMSLSREFKQVKLKEPLYSIQAIASIIVESPTRFLRIVIIPELALYSLW